MYVVRRGISVIGGAMADRLGTTTDCHSRLGVCTVGDAPFPAPPVGGGAFRTRERGHTLS
jgi:hypothetical protein